MMESIPSSAVGEKEPLLGSRGGDLQAVEVGGGEDAVRLKNKGAQ